MEKKRSAIIWIIIAAFVYYGSYGIWKLMESIVYSLTQKAYFISTIPFSLVFWFVPLVFTLLALAAFGLFKFKEWGRKLSVALSWTSVLLYIIIWIVLMLQELTLTPTKTLVRNSITMSCAVIFFLYVIYYLTRPKVKRDFGEQNPE